MTNIELHSFMLLKQVKMLQNEYVNHYRNQELLHLINQLLTEVIWGHFILHCGSCL